MFKRKPIPVVVQNKKDFDKEQEEKSLIVVGALGLMLLVIIGYFLYIVFISPLINLWNNTLPVNKIIFILVVGIIIFGIVALIRGLKNSVKQKRGKSRSKRKGFFRFFDLNDNLLAWTLIFGLVVWLISKYVQINFMTSLSPFIFLIIAGLTFALVRWIMLMLLYGNGFILDGWFLVWALKSSIVYFGLVYLFDYLKMSQGFIYFVLMGFLFHFITLFIRANVLRKFRKKGLGRNALIFFLLVIVYGLSFI